MPIRHIQRTTSLQQLDRGDRLLFSSDENALTRHIQATHSPDGRFFDAKPLLRIVEDIFIGAAPIIDSLPMPDTPQARTEALDEKIYEASFLDLLDALAFVMERVASEITCTGGADAHTSTISILTILSPFSWDAKLAIALAAFAMNYGEFWLVARTYTSNQLAKSVAVLKQLSDILEHPSMLKPRFNVVKDLTKVMLENAKCIVQFKDLPRQYISMDFPALSAAYTRIPITIYWTIRSIVVCASQITGLIGMGHEHITSTAEEWELSSLAHKIANMHSHLETQLEICYRHIDENRENEIYRYLKHLFGGVYIDNMRVLKALLDAGGDLQPLFDGSAKKRVSIDILRRKNVLLLISDLDILQDEIVILEQIYNESRLHPTRQESQYEIVWLPIVDHVDDNMQKKFESLQAGMTWYSFCHPSLIDRAVIRFVKQEWHFEKKPILVVLDPFGRVACPNAFHMMWIWGSVAFPFTTAREEALWWEESWRLELLVNGIDPEILHWIQEEKYICLYGGEDIEWIRKFTNTARAVAQAADIPLEMVYVGKSNPKERVRRNIDIIAAEKLSHYWQDLTSVWFFWIRIESMWQSKNQLRRTAKNDPIMKEIMTMLSFDGSGGGWAIFARGSEEMVKAKGGTFLTCLLNFSDWKDHIQQKGFMAALRDRLHELLGTEHHCNRLVLSSATGTIPEQMVCLDCGRIMDRLIMYRCCDE